MGPRLVKPRLGGTDGPLHQRPRRRTQVTLMARLSLFQDQSHDVIAHHVRVTPPPTPQQPEIRRQARTTQKARENSTEYRQRRNTYRAPHIPIRDTRENTHTHPAATSSPQTVRTPHPPPTRHPGAPAHLPDSHPISTRDEGTGHPRPRSQTRRPSPRTPLAHPHAGTTRTREDYFALK